MKGAPASVLNHKLYLLEGASMQTKLINFRSPEELQSTFDMVCRYKSQSRTQVLINLMRDYISQNHQPNISDVQALRDIKRNLSEFIKVNPHGQILSNRKKSEFDGIQTECDWPAP